MQTCKLAVDVYIPINMFIYGNFCDMPMHEIFRFLLFNNIQIISIHGKREFKCQCSICGWILAVKDVYLFNAYNVYYIFYWSFVRTFMCGSLHDSSYGIDKSYFGMIVVSLDIYCRDYWSGYNNFHWYVEANKMCAEAFPPGNTQ